MLLPSARLRRSVHRWRGSRRRMLDRRRCRSRCWNLSLRLGLCLGMRLSCLCDRLRRCRHSNLRNLTEDVRDRGARVASTTSTTITTASALAESAPERTRERSEIESAAATATTATRSSTPAKRGAERTPDRAERATPIILPDVLVRHGVIPRITVKVTGINAWISAVAVTAVAAVAAIATITGEGFHRIAGDCRPIAFVVVQRSVVSNPNRHDESLIIGD